MDIYHVVFYVSIFLELGCIRWYDTRNPGTIGSVIIILIGIFSLLALSSIMYSGIHSGLGLH